MPIGPFVRSLFGSRERWIAESYRKIFIDLDDFADVLVKWVPHPASILEVGGGEGAMTERLASRYPTASITSIDISTKIGRLYSGPRDRVTFRQQELEVLASERPGEFDLVVLCDVLHHVPPEHRASLLKAVRAAMRPDGKFVLKDWTPKPTPIHAFTWSMERFITRDNVSYPSAMLLESLTEAIFGRNAIEARSFVRPWKNNLALLIRAS